MHWEVYSDGVIGVISLAWVCKKFLHLKVVKYSQRRALLRIEQ